MQKREECLGQVCGEQCQRKVEKGKRNASIVPQRGDPGLSLYVHTIPILFLNIERDCQFYVSCSLLVKLSSVQFSSVQEDFLSVAVCAYNPHPDSKH